MAYQVMARARRPDVFDQVVAQDHIVKTLQNAIRTGRIAHAYLFSGPRGTGKTTTARLLAKALNCDQGPTPDPCGTCDSCLAIKAGRSLDVREIDGASTGLVEDVRQLREEVGYAASKGKRKVYIIDEVHMLSTPAFNALLKTLEEPPPHVVFVFATTEPLKVPDTILSRCQRYNFRRIPTTAIVAELKAIVATEGIPADEDALYMIARKAEGALRDALSLMDQVLSFSEDGVRADTVRDLLGIVPRDLYFELTDAIRDRDAAKAMGLIGGLIDEGGDVGDFTEGLLEHFRHLLVARAHGVVIGADLPEADLERYRTRAAAFDEADLVRMLNTVADLDLNLPRVSDDRFWLELTAMKLIHAATTVELTALIDRLDRLPGGTPPAGSAPPQAATAAQPPAPRVARGRPNLPRPGKPSAPEGPPAAAPRAASRETSGPAVAREEEAAETDPPPAAPTVEAIRARWSDVVNWAREASVSVGTYLAECEPRCLDGDRLVVVFKRHRDFHANRVRQNRTVVEAAVKAVLGADVTVSCEVDYDAEPEEAKAERRVEEDDRVQMALRIFGGEIVRR